MLKLLLLNGRLLQLWPINHFGDAAINYASTKIVLKHAESYFTQEKLLHQVIAAGHDEETTQFQFMSETTSQIDPRHYCPLRLERKAVLLLDLRDREEGSRTKLPTKKLLWLHNSLAQLLLYREI